MFKVIRLPQLAKDMQEATIVACLVELGNEVKIGDCLFEIETDKALVEMESPDAGFIKALIAKEGDSLGVDDVMLVLGEKDSELTDEVLTSLVGESSKKAAAGNEEKSRSTSVAEISEADAIGSICEQGTDGEMVYKLGQRVAVNRLGKITAKKMVQSKREIPCFYLNVTVNAAAIVEYRTEVNKAGSEKISYNDFVMRALAAGLQKFPVMTGQLDGDSIVLADSIGIGLAISAPAGLVAPIVKDVEKKTLQQVAADSRALIDRAQNGKLRPDDFVGGCITLSNLGAFGIDSFVPIVAPGQCSILGVGKISDICVPDDDKLSTGKAMKMTLAVDHRIANGAEAARFLDFVVKQLESSDTL
ncbi:MAG: 2-oxo acid dehydrogenase subunit E2 [Anaerohalosphaeraceae bacterium]|nr:2-oxo acid dehydrogenase subunit E2 [Anaerohalosphaeraceae bacterium]